VKLDSTESPCALVEWEPAGSNWKVSYCDMGMGKKISQNFKCDKLSLGFKISKILSIVQRIRWVMDGKQLKEEEDNKIQLFIEENILKDNIISEYEINEIKKCIERKLMALKQNNVISKVSAGEI